MTMYLTVVFGAAGIGMTTRHIGEPWWVAAVLGFAWGYLIERTSGLLS